MTNPTLSELLVIGLPITDDVKFVIDDYELSIIEEGADWFLVKDEKYGGYPCGYPVDARNSEDVDSDDEA